MMLLGIGVANGILAWLTIVVALVGALVAVALLWRVLQPILEIDRYASRILESAGAIEKNLAGVDELSRTRELAATVPRATERYLGRGGTAA